MKLTVLLLLCGFAVATVQGSPDLWKAFREFLRRLNAPPEADDFLFTLGKWATGLIAPNFLTIPEDVWDVEAEALNKFHDFNQDYPVDADGDDDIWTPNPRYARDTSPETNRARALEFLVALVKAFGLESLITEFSKDIVKSPHYSKEGLDQLLDLLSDVLVKHTKSSERKKRSTGDGNEELYNALRSLGLSDSSLAVVKKMPATRQFTSLDQILPFLTRLAKTTNAYEVEAVRRLLVEQGVSNEDFDRLLAELRQGPIIFGAGEWGDSGISSGAGEAPSGHSFPGSSSSSTPSATGWGDSSANSRQGPIFGSGEWSDSGSPQGQSLHSSSPTAGWGDSSDTKHYSRNTPQSQWGNTDSDFITRISPTYYESPNYHATPSYQTSTLRHAAPTLYKKWKWLSRPANSQSDHDGGWYYVPTRGYPHRSPYYTR